MQATHPAVRVTREGDVTIVTLDRPAVRNAVDADTARQLHDAFVAFERDDRACVAVFHGAGGHFCAGWDLQAGAHIDPAATTAALEWPTPSPAPGPLGPMGPTRLALSKPVIAAVAGAAVAGGLELALWCDLRVMEADAYFGVYCRRFGVPLIDGGTVRLPRIVGMGRAMDLILSGRKVEAPEALAIGLANRVVPGGQALAEAVAWAQALAKFPQATMRADRASAHAQWGLSVEAAMREEWAQGRERLHDAVAGAARFAAGAGRHGRF